MWKLGFGVPVQWYALFCYGKMPLRSIAQSVYNTTPLENKALDEEAVGWQDLVNGWYNIVHFLPLLLGSFAPLTLGPKKVHFVCLIMAGSGTFDFPFYKKIKYLLFAPMTVSGMGLGGVWMGVPILL